METKMIDQARQNTKKRTVTGELDQLATEANHRHGAVMEALRNAVYAAKDAGDALHAAKELVPHGQWGVWLRESFDASPETARVYMRVSEHWENQVKPVLDANPGMTLENVKRILRRAKPKDGIVPPAEQTHEIVRTSLRKSFQRWIDRLPDEAVEMLNKRWDDVWEGVQRHLFDDSKIEFDADETPTRAYTQPGIPEADVVEAAADPDEAEWDDWNTNVESDSAHKNEVEEADAADSESVVDYRFGAIEGEDNVPDFTPIERHGKIWTKRDDMFKVAGAQGGKVRACWKLSQGAIGLVTASSRHSPQMQIVARIAERMGIPCHCHIPAAKEVTPEMRDAEAHGAVLVKHRPGHSNVIWSRAMKDAVEHDWTYIPFGMESTDAMNCTRQQVKNIPGGVKRIVIALGSGMSAAGVLHGLRNAALDIPVLGVRIGKKPIKCLDKFAPRGWREQMTIVDATEKYKYRTPVKATIGEITLDPIYEAKAAEYLQDGDLFWIIGVRAGVK